MQRLIDCENNLHDVQTNAAADRIKACSYQQARDSYYIERMSGQYGCIKG